MPWHTNYFDLNSKDSQARSFKYIFTVFCLLFFCSPFPKAGHKDSSSARWVIEIRFFPPPPSGWSQTLEVISNLLLPFPRQIPSKEISDPSCRTSVLSAELFSPVLRKRKCHAERPERTWKEACYPWDPFIPSHPRDCPFFTESIHKTETFPPGL